MGTNMSATNKGDDKITPQVQVKTYYRLTPSQYQELEKKALSKITFRDESGPIQSGYLNGVEAVLRLVREGFTTQ